MTGKWARQPLHGGRREEPGVTGPAGPPGGRPYARRLPRDSCRAQTGRRLPMWNPRQKYCPSRQIPLDWQHGPHGPTAAPSVGPLDSPVPQCKRCALQAVVQSLSRKHCTTVQKPNRTPFTLRFRQISTVVHGQEVPQWSHKNMPSNDFFHTSTKTT